MFMWNSTYPGRVILYPNLTAKNEDVRAFFQNKDVRHALSLALNRPEINEVVHFGLGEPRQWAMWPNSRYYREGDTEHWAAYSPDEANALLDAAGYSERDGEGFRLFPNGDRIRWILQYSVDQQDVPATLELAAEYWREIGLETSLTPVSRQLLEELIAANDIEMTVWLGDISDITWPNFPRTMLPGITNAKWGRAWELWLLGQTDNELAEEPPEEVKWVWDKWLAMRSAPTDEEHESLAREMWDWYYDYLPAFATVGVPQVVLLKNNLTNFPETGSWGFSVIRAVPAHPEQFFFKT
jgi:peptide/nickel transport system substrate-binding protein